MTTQSAIATTTLLDELQISLRSDTVARRVATLRQVTDLFIGRCVDYSDEQIALFDDVFSYLMKQVESSALAILAQRLASVDSAPPRTMRTLALDPMIDIAAPPLAQYDRLDDATLIETAQQRSQQHLLAISTRRTISEAVTDALIQHGDDTVVHSTANNPGARFSEQGFATLVTRAEHNDDIATSVGLRTDIPRHHFLKLVAKASDAVRASLEAAHPHATKEVAIAVHQATRRARSVKEGMLPETETTHALVRSLYNDGRLDEKQVVKFARADDFDAANAAIACLSGVTIELAETIMIESHVEGIFILAKVCDFTWPTVQAIIAMRAKLSDLVPTETKEHREAYARLRKPTAQQVLRFHRMQQSTQSP